MPAYLYEHSVSAQLCEYPQLVECPFSTSQWTPTFLDACNFLDNLYIQLFAIVFLTNCWFSYHCNNPHKFICFQTNCQQLEPLVCGNHESAVFTVLKPLRRITQVCLIMWTPHVSILMWTTQVWIMWTPPYWIIKWTLCICIIMKTPHVCINMGIPT